MNNLLLDITQLQGVENAGVTGAIDKSLVSQLLGDNTNDLAEQTFPDALQALFLDTMPTEQQKLSNLQLLLGSSQAMQELDMAQETQAIVSSNSEIKSEINISTTPTLESFYNTENNLQPIQLKGEIEALNPKMTGNEVVNAALLPEQEIQLTKEILNPKQETQIVKDTSAPNSEIQYSGSNNNDKLTAYNFITEINGESKNLKLLVPQLNVENSNNKQPIQGYLISNDESAVAEPNTKTSLENNKHEIILPVQVSLKQGRKFNFESENGIEKSKTVLQAKFAETSESKLPAITGKINENIIKAVVTIDQKAIVEQLNKSLQPHPELLPVDLKNNPVNQGLVINQQLSNIEDLDKNILKQQQQINSDGNKSEDNLLTKQVKQNNPTTNNLLSNEQQNLGSNYDKKFKQAIQFDNKLNQFQDLVENNPAIKNELVKDINPQKNIPQQSLDISRAEDFNWDKFKINFNRLNYNQLRDVGEIRLKLNPAHLGNLKISIITNAEEVVARFELSSEKARLVVENNLPQLRENLEKAGIKIDTLEVVLSDNQQKNHRQSQFSRKEFKQKNMKIGNKKISQIKTIINSAQIVSSAVGLNILA